MNDAQETEQLLKVAAARAAGEPAFLAWVLAEYQRIESLDDVALTQYLIMSDPNRLTGLRLCLRPRDDHFPQDVDAIAATYGLDVDALTTLIRHVEGMRHMADAPAGDAGRLLAARARGPRRRGRPGEGGAP